MQLEFNLPLPADYFFSRLIESSIYDLEQQTQKKILPQQLRGFSCQKTLSNGAKSVFTVTDYQPNQKYGYSLKTGRNLYQVLYEVTSMGPETMLFTYTEGSQGRSNTIQANNTVTHFLMGWFRKRRFKKMTRQIVADYQAQSGQE
ncbi:DUF3284 domain-containing protein [Lactobacillus sp. DCY120]|uniref:DUF3284 domain-containing protein n=1 Tax=Bombilactobacillus apium TaxID=2675299 RepID=A0A850R1P7_9LACO|nr:DUF3284 domain-containing protein [Bombilactobacillus apium]NVY96280.1 DUF3284 domain-containing protein [Bombilactobacillus apium]